MESKLTKKQKTESEAINPDHTQEAKTAPSDSGEFPDQVDARHRFPGVLGSNENHLSPTANPFRV